MGWKWATCSLERYMRWAWSYTCFSLLNKCALLSVYGNIHWTVTNGNIHSWWWVYDLILIWKGKKKTTTVTRNTTKQNYEKFRYEKKTMNFICMYTLYYLSDVADLIIKIYRGKMMDQHLISKKSVFTENFSEKSCTDAAVYLASLPH